MKILGGQIAQRMNAQFPGAKEPILANRLLSHATGYYLNGVTGQTIDKLPKTSPEGLVKRGLSLYKKIIVNTGDTSLLQTMVKDTQRFNPDHARQLAEGVASSKKSSPALKETAHRLLTQA